jgi:hypothetical protein
MRPLKWCSVTAALLLCVSASLLEARQQGSNNLRLTLERKYGHPAQECRLSLEVSRGTGSATLQCTRNAVPRSNQRPLTTPEIQSLTELVLRASLFEGGQGTGKDSTPVDGTFETLEVRQGSTVVIVVTSGNEVFAANQARKQMLDFIKTVEKSLGN